LIAGAGRAVAHAMLRHATMEERMKGSIWSGAAIAAVLAVILSATGPTLAAPVAPDLQVQLMALFNRWESLLGQGKLADAAAISVPELRKQIAAAMKSKKDAAGLAEMVKDMTPDKLEPRHASLSKDGKRATIITVATRKIPEDAKMPPDGPKPGSVVQTEITLKFERDGKDWKFAEQLFGMDPAQIKHCHDDAEETVAAYDQTSSQSAGGLINRVEFKPDHTLVVFRILDEENCGILPARDKLAKDGFDASSLVPYAMLELSGYPHKTDQQRVWAEKFRIVQED
jgi:hypothetical protein